MKDGKAPGQDGIPAEVWKYGGQNLLVKLHELIVQIWQEGEVPQAWKDASIVTIFKRATEQNVATTEVSPFCP